MALNHQVLHVRNQIQQVQTAANAVLRIAGNAGQTRHIPPVFSLSFLVSLGLIYRVQVVAAHILHQHQLGGDLVAHLADLHPGKRDSLHAVDLGHGPEASLTSNDLVHRQAASHGRVRHFPGVWVDVARKRPYQDGLDKAGLLNRFAKLLQLAEHCPVIVAGDNLERKDCVVVHCHLREGV